MIARRVQNWQYLITAGLPFVYYSGHFSPHEVPKTWVVWGLAILGVGLGVFEVEKKQNDKRLMRLVLVLMLWLVVSALWSGEFYQSWWGNPYRSDGLLTLFAMIVVGMMVEVRPWLMRGLGLTSLLLAVMVIVRANPSDVLTIGNVNMLSGYLALSLPIIWSYLRYKWLVILPIIAVMMLGSWGGILTVLCWLALVIAKKNVKLMSGMIMVAVVVVLGIYARDQRLDLPVGHVVAEGRGRILSKAVIAVKMRPVTGWGWARFSRAFGEIDYPVKYEIDANVDRTHSSVLEYGVSGGGVAMSLYLTIAWMAIVRLHASKNVGDQVLWAVLILYMIQSQTNVTSVTQDWLFWLGVGRAMYL